MDGLERWQECLFVCTTLRYDAWNLAVDVKNEVVFLHASEDRIEGVEGCHTSI